MWKSVPGVSNRGHCALGLPGTGKKVMPEFLSQSWQSGMLGKPSKDIGTLLQSCDCKLQEPFTA